MKTIITTSLIAIVFTGCTTIGGVAERFGLNKNAPAPTETPNAPSDPFIKTEEQVSETPLTPATAAPPPAPEAQTVAALDTTTPEQRALATAPAQGASKTLGKTVVSLGSPTEPGLWIKTPLVKKETQGRVTNPANGKSSIVTLIPIEGAATAGSRMSLSALRLIGASLTDLTEVELSLET